MKGILKIMKSKVKEFIFLGIENILEALKMGNSTVKGNLFIQMETYMKVILRIIKKMVKEH